MTKIENMREDSGLGRLLSECFAGGERLRRELRLSAEQAEELAAAYPADVRPMGGSWYEITFQVLIPPSPAPARVVARRWRSKQRCAARAHVLLRT